MSLTDDIKVEILKRLAGTDNLARMEPEGTVGRLVLIRWSREEEE